MAIVFQLRVVDFFYKKKLTVSVYFGSEDHEECSKIKDVRGEITGRLSKIVNIISQSKEEDSDAKVVFCPIVSRAGTDIEATLSHLRDDKPTIVFVLHHTFTTDYSAPRSSRYEKKNLIMVDILFHEDLGLLNCSKNDAALSKASTYLKHYAKLQYEVNTTRVILCAVGILVSHKVGLILLFRYLTRRFFNCLKDWFRPKSEVHIEIWNMD
ncbi:uncharacterized protein LOC131345610 [Hemibagrus wyckioides]|uniref:uncharacterized protein LOC131345610 n=1 Tax=Hemibagrus wyckioides TaxID=337641 RepID=UPI00266BD87F|nr:uncharacterized protein LOC131345610 [Hemibagrus wyckioides]